MQWYKIGAWGSGDLFYLCRVHFHGYAILLFQFFDSFDMWFVSLVDLKHIKPRSFWSLTSYNLFCMCGERANLCDCWVSLLSCCLKSVICFNLSTHGCNLMTLYLKFYLSVPTGSRTGAGQDVINLLGASMSEGISTLSACGVVDCVLSSFYAIFFANGCIS